MRYFVILSLFCLMLVTVKANAYLDNDLLNGEWVGSGLWAIRDVLLSVKLRVFIFHMEKLVWTFYGRWLAELNFHLMRKKIPRIQVRFSWLAT